ncbi:Rieske (2Fe-2S) protein [Halogranum rubrum]|uniref:Rieske domain-containing protein n=1 Tax=Halogranum salarium B-1 TaxID=1210908 RepID=J3F098_9EURY|nr:Rieske 2Fe-2S domain-containing protein [Halogranum salarium]EJN61467.1 hypothetical protein HSB1_05080 [Halogranum salarium B-1]
MDDPVRVTLESNDEERTVRIHDDEGELSVGDATFRFDVTGVRMRSADDETHETHETPNETDANGESVDAGDDEDATADPHYLAAVDDIPERGTLRFEARTGRYGVEGILQRTDEGVLAWENACPHEPDVKLDKGFGALVNGGQLVCHKHGARFNCDDGFCTRGPCRGSVLDAIGVEVRDDEVYLDDERFEAGYALDG